MLASCSDLVRAKKGHDLPVPENKGSIKYKMASKTAAVWIGVCTLLADRKKLLMTDVNVWLKWPMICDLQLALSFL